jgi:prevent-host-death family protein
MASVQEISHSMTDSYPSGSRRQPTLAVPLAAAKNQLSALVARVEQGEEIAITRRGMPVVRLVPDPGDRNHLLCARQLRTLRLDSRQPGDALQRRGSRPAAGGRCPRPLVAAAGVHQCAAHRVPSRHMVTWEQEKTDLGLLSLDKPFLYGEVICRPRGVY